MDYLPLFVDLRGRPVLVVGGGPVAARRAELLLRAGAAVHVVATPVADEVETLAAAGRIRLARRPVTPADVAGMAAVFGAAADPAVDEAVSAAARAANVPVNIVDRPDLSTFILPAIVDRDPVVIAISSGGSAPVLARNLRAQLEGLLPARFGALARFAGRFRRTARAMIESAVLRRRFWEQVFAGPVAEAVLSGDEAAARAGLVRLLNRPSRDAAGAVYVVGAGPGDPDLLTFRALRLMQQADVVIHDGLIGPEILDRVRRDAERIHVGAANGRQPLTPEDVNALMLREARAGRRVLHLKPGDPFASDRCPEAEFLRAHGIDVIAVPGIAASSDAPAKETHNERAVSW